MGIDGVRVRWGTAADRAALVPLMMALYAHDVPDAPVPDEGTVLDHLSLLLAPDTPHRLAIAWDRDGRALGLAAVGAFVSVSDPRPERWRQAELKELFVLPECRSLSLGQVLLTWVQARAAKNGAHRLDWHVKRDNAKGIAFYQRHGGQILTHRLSMRARLDPTEAGP